MSGASDASSTLIVGSTTTARALVAAALALAGCSRLHISPLQPPPYRAEIPAAYDSTWGALVRALAHQNVPLRAIARDSGVIASDEFVSPINLYADCGQLSGDQLEGEASLSFMVFVLAHGPDVRSRPVAPKV